MQTRPIEPSDVPAVEAFLVSASDELGFAVVGERKFIELDHRPAGWLVEDADGSLVGVAPTVTGPGSVTFEVGTASDEVAGLLTATVVDGARGGLVRVWSHRGRFREIYEAAGFAPERTLHKLAVDLPVEERTSDLTMRGYRPGDEDAWVAVNNRAFVGHPEQGSLTVADFLERTELPWWEPEGLRLGFRNGRLAGFCWTKVHPDADGEIYAIAVDPELGGRGWGRDMLAEGLAHLDRVGCRTGHLWVDAANEPAMWLYRDIGFRRVRTDFALVR